MSDWLQVDHCIRHKRLQPATAAMQCTVCKTSAEVRQRVTGEPVQSVKGQQQLDIRGSVAGVDLPEGSH